MRTIEQVFGIDPGEKGAVGISNSTGVHTVELLKYLDVDWFRAATEESVCHVFIEKAQAMPKQGVSSVFTYGVGFGTLIGWMEALKLPYTLVTPREWTKELHKGCTGETAKEKSLVAAKRLMPGVSFITNGGRVPHAGLIDAALITEYGRRQIF